MVQFPGSDALDVAWRTQSSCSDRRPSDLPPRYRRSVEPAGAATGSPVPPVVPGRRARGTGAPPGSAQRATGRVPRPDRRFPVLVPAGGREGYRV